MALEAQQLADWRRLIREDDSRQPEAGQRAERRPNRKAVSRLAELIAKKRPQMIEALQAGDGKRYGELWSEVERAAMQVYGDDFNSPALRVIREGLAPDALVPRERKA